MTFERWLALREPADAEARSVELVERLPASGPHVIHDLGCGTGAMGRWLAPLLSGTQHWVLHDRDEALLDAASVPAAATMETRLSDITRLAPDELAGATLVTASALLDMLTGRELSRVVEACAEAGCPTLLTLSVVGRVELAPADPLDARVMDAFNAHQRRGRLLGPDAAAAAVERFRDLGAEVLVRPSPWRLGPSHTELAAEWFSGWVGAASEQQPELAAGADAYARRRLEQARRGQLAVTLHHTDLLALPRSGRR
ncbi:MAG TPA: class I SAM-dependent methyltransferase [Thermoleophilaceae bacterium]